MVDNGSYSHAGVNCVVEKEKLSKSINKSDSWTMITF